MISIQLDPQKFLELCESLRVSTEEYRAILDIHYDAPDGMDISRPRIILKARMLLGLSNSMDCACHDYVPEPDKGS